MKTKEEEEEEMSTVRWSFLSKTHVAAVRLGNTTPLIVFDNGIMMDGLGSAEITQKRKMIKTVRVLNVRARGGCLVQFFR